MSKEMCPSTPAEFWGWTTGGEATWSIMSNLNVIFSTIISIPLNLLKVLISFFHFILGCSFYLYFFKTCLLCPFSFLSVLVYSPSPIWSVPFLPLTISYLGLMAKKKAGISRLLTPLLPPKSYWKLQHIHVLGLIIWLDILEITFLLSRLCVPMLGSLKASHFWIKWAAASP
jgi:hypothetical protein